MHQNICLTTVIATLLAGGCSIITDKELERAVKTRQPIFLRYVVASPPDEYGGVDAHANLLNTSDRTVKYVDINGIGFNRVSDPVAGRDRPSAEVTLRFTGPLPPRRTPGNSTWPLVWTNQQVECVVVMRITVTFMDGSVAILQGADLDHVTSRDLREGCPPNAATEEAAGRLAFWQESIERADADAAAEALAEARAEAERHHGHSLRRERHRAARSRRRDWVRERRRKKKWYRRSRPRPEKR